MPASSRISWPMLLGSVASMGLALAICGGFYWRESSQIEQNWRIRESVRVRMFGNLVSQDFHFITENLQALAEGDGLQAYLASGRPDDLQRAVRRAIFYSRHNDSYDQVRYLDERGREVLRINQGGREVPAAGLQTKAGRKYFQEAVKLSAGQIFISAFDLNVEQGRIEQPLKPMLRFSIPVFDASGRRRGVYVINYRGADLLTRLLQFLPTYQNRFRMLNGQGYWLRAADPATEWGFMFPDRAGFTLARQDPALWTQIQAEEDGQVLHAGGLFTWHRFSPREALGNGPDKVRAEDDFLVIASEMSANEWSAIFTGLRQGFLIVAVILGGLLIALLWFFRSRLETRQELDRFFTLSHDLLCIAGFDGYFKRLNPAWERTFGFTTAELTARPFMEFIHPDDREPTRAQAARQAGGLEAMSFENRYLCKDGTYRWLQWNARPMTSEQLIFATARDVTDSKKIEQIHLQFRALFESLPGLYLVLTPAFKIVAVSDAYLKATMTQRAEILGRGLFEVFPDNPEDAAATGVSNLRTSLNRVLQTAASDTMAVQKYDVRRPDGTFEERFWSPINSPILGTDRQIEYIIHRVEDVTDFLRQKSPPAGGEHGPQSRLDRMEAEIFRSSQEVQAANQLLHAANAELEAFSYSVSHDLRAPLRHIDGFAGLLTKHAAGSLDEKGNRYVAVISESARKMGRLIDDLLAFSRTGRTQMQLTRVNQDELVAAVIRDGRFQRTDRPIEWRIAPLPVVQADHAMLRQVWFNFIDNAVKYSGQVPQPRIEIGVQPGATPLEQVCFIRDNGAGFDMRYVDKLFGVFQRLHTEAEFQGTGIGLANVRRIILRHGGRTWAEGTPGAGATFYFSLPVSDSSAPPA